MIEFSGYLSGKTEKYFWKRNAAFVQKFIFIGVILCIPLPLLFVEQAGNWSPVVGYLGFWILFGIVFPFLPKSKKEKEKITPYKIIIQDGYISVQTKASSESRKIDDVKIIYDFGEWYSFVFPIGKVSMNFICQKDLISKGTLKDFEELFKGKIIDRTPKL